MTREIKQLAAKLYILLLSYFLPVLRNLQTILQLKHSLLNYFNPMMLTAAKSSPTLFLESFMQKYGY